MLLQNFCGMAANVMPGGNGGNYIGGAPVKRENSTAGTTIWGYLYSGSSSGVTGYVLSPLMVPTNTTTNNNGRPATYVGLVFGSGTTAPTYTDYCLENKITSGFTFDSGSFNRSGEILTCTATITNTSGSDLTINEIGLRISDSSTAASAWVALLTRDVLDTPVVLSDGETKTFTVTINTALFSTGYNY